MPIAIIGSGHVGLVVAGCLAELGHEVVCVDIDRKKIDALNAGETPIHEDYLPELLARYRDRSLTFTTSLGKAVEKASVIFIAVGTPTKADSHADLSFVDSATREIARSSRSFKVLVEKSTVPVGTAARLQATMNAEGWRNSDFAVVANPEFLREGSAVRDFMEPSLVVVGSHNRAAAERVAALYTGLRVETSVVALRTAELIKYTCNTFHALKIAFANEIGTLSAALGLDGAEVMETVCRDTKLNISPVYLKPGFAFGGSCLPKDLRGLTYRARQLDLDLPLLNSVLPSNEAHITRAFQRVMEVGARKIGVYGLAFKPNTDDLRESPGVALIERLIGKGCDVKIYDPHIQLDAIYGSNEAFLLKALPHIGRSMEKSLQAVMGWAELIVVTQQPTAEAKQALSQSPVPVINVASSEASSVPKLEPVR